MEILFRRLIYLLCLISIMSCTNPASKGQEQYSSIISTNKDSLSLLINLETYPPKKVIYEYTVHDNSAKSRLDISAPSDSYLEAILLYDSVPVIEGNGIDIDKLEFDFVWLPKDFSENNDPEIIQSGKDSVFSRNAKYALTKNAIFLKVNWN